MDRTVRTSLLITLAIAAGCSGPKPTRPTPDFTVEQVAPPAGRVKLSSHKGHPVLIDFWATWCAPCRETMPEIDKIYRKYKEKGLVVLAVSAEKRAVVRGFQPTSGVSYPLFVDTFGEANTRFSVDAIPHLFLLDKKGDVVYEETGSPLNVQELEKAIEGALGS